MATLSDEAGTAASKGPSREDVAEAIRQRINRADLVPGQRLVEAELCELLGASRGNVRNALVDLSHEGMVERIANRGARVRVVGLEEALHIAEVRRVVEGLCVRLAAERIGDPDIAALKAIGEEMKDVAAGGGRSSFADLTHRVFEIYVRVAGNPVAEEVLGRLRARNVRHRFRLTFRPGRAQVAVPYWLDLIDGICARDPDAAEQALDRHSSNVQEVMRALAHEHTPFARLYNNDE